MLTRIYHVFATAAGLPLANKEVLVTKGTSQTPVSLYSQEGRLVGRVGGTDANGVFTAYVDAGDVHTLTLREPVSNLLLELVTSVSEESNLSRAGIKELCGDGVPDDSTSATAVVVSAGANNDLTFTAVEGGVEGNAYSVEVVQDTEPSAALSITEENLPAWKATIHLPATAPAVATLLVASAGGDNDLTFTTVGTGLAQNARQIEIVQPAGLNSPLTVTTVDLVTTISLPTDGAGAPVITTATEVKAAWDASAAVGIATVAVEGTGAGTVTAAAAANFTGGSAGGDPVAATANQVKTAWDASPAVDKATVAVEDSGAGNVAVAAAVPFTGGVCTGKNYAGPGSRYTDFTNAEMYINAGTLTAQVWKKVTKAA